VIAWVLTGVAVIVVLSWLFRPRQGYTPDPDDPLDDGSSAPIDREELERAEREVRGLGVGARPEDERPEDDWGPGAPKA
jgi:hypothetical protein